MIATNYEFLTDAGLAELLHVSVRTLQRRVKDDGFPKPVQFGRCRRWDQADVVDYLRQRSASMKPAAEAADL